MRKNVGGDEEIPHAELIAWYQNHLDEYEFPARARFEVLTAKTGLKRSRAAAWDMLAAMGNDVLEGKPFAEIARTRSEGPTAASGGGYDWTTKGSLASKVIVTGIPNFDNCVEYYDTPFEHRRHVLVATSDARETYKYENRKAFIHECLDIAFGRTLVFKLHPNEQVDRAVAEIRQHAPHAHVYHSGDINPMIAHCDVLITKYSTVVYIGMALGKEVYSAFPLEQLRKLTPLQNGGRSALAIADVCREVMDEQHSLHDYARAKAWPSYRVPV
jgi:hypothetical protein